VSGAVVWLPNDTATREHAVPRDRLTHIDLGWDAWTLCRPRSHSGLRLLSREKVIGTGLPRCKTCLKRATTMDPPPAAAADEIPAAGARQNMLPESTVETTCG
jgi:hypothetical protein